MSFIEDLEFNPNRAKDTFIRTGYNVLKNVGNKIMDYFGGPKAEGELYDTVERLALDGSFKFYGNWGGPLYSAGKYYKRDEAITKDDIMKNPPQDKLDELFMKHDLRYQRGATNQSPEDRKQALKRADELFIKEVNELLKSGQASIKEQIAGRSAELAFKAKLASDIGYNIDYLDNPEARKTVNEYFNEVDNDAPIKNDVFVYPSQLFQNEIEKEYNIPVLNKFDNINDKLFESQKQELELRQDIEIIRDVILALADV
ncbi:MAG: hypothetical protein IPM51_12225 [Sphingobacteriaceae bacterium]|nr:hypothetical protein [Sphingobacteriaceae bacterium]